MHGGTCSRTTSVTGAALRCECEQGFQGRLCEEVVPCTELDVAQCSGNGVCRRRDDASRFCDCRVGFYGSTCQNRNLCDPVFDTCKNGAICSSEAPGKFRCSCATGFFGRTCELHRTCLHMTCFNRGTCVRGEREWCMCMEGFTGERCETILDACDEGYTCRNLPGRYHCACRDTTDVNCHEDSTPLFFVLSTTFSGDDVIV